MSEPVPPQAQPTAESITATLLDMLYAFLRPLFTGFAEPAAADRAARAALLFYQPRTQHEAMLAARAIAFGLAAQDNLRLSMADDLTVAAKLRLRSNANALDRAAERNHAALEKTQAARAAVPDEAELADMLRDTQGMIAQANAQIANAQIANAQIANAQIAGAQIAGAKAAVKPASRPAPAPATAQAQAATHVRGQTASASRPAQPAGASQPVQAAAVKPAVPAAAAAAVAAALGQGPQPPRMVDPRTGLFWANAMTFVADEMTAGLSAIPPAHRKQTLMRARLLGSAAQDVIGLASGTAGKRQT
jgi:hypothetical protein